MSNNAATESKSHTIHLEFQFFSTLKVSTKVSKKVSKKVSIRESEKKRSGVLRHFLEFKSSFMMISKGKRHLAS